MLSHADYSASVGYTALQCLLIHGASMSARRIAVWSYRLVSLRTRPYRRGLHDPQNAPDRLRIQGIDATASANASHGAMKPSVFRGLVLSERAILSRSLGVGREVGTSWQVLANKAVGVLVGASLPWALCRSRVTNSRRPETLTGIGEVGHPYVDAVRPSQPADAQGVEST